jgi:predicted Zn-dependent protease
MPASSGAEMPATATATVQQLVEHGLATSTADDCIIVADHRTSANLRWANNTLTTNGVMRGIDVTVIAFARQSGGVCVGTVSGSAGSLEQVETLVAAADAAARLASPAPDAHDLVGDVTDAAWDDEPGETDIHTFDTFAPALGEAFGRARAGGRVLYGFVDHHVTTTYLGSSTGLRLRHVQPTGHYACTGKTADLASSAWVGGATRDFVGVDPLAVEAALEQRLGWAARRVDLPAGRYDTILPPTAVADLMIYAYWSAGARDAHDGQSVYSRRGGGTRIGEAIARPEVILYSDPAYAGLECTPYAVVEASGNDDSVFDNGLPLTRTDWIDRGRLAALRQTRETADLTGQRVTPAIDNLVLEVEGATGSLDDVVAATERGLLLTCLWYIRSVDPQTLLLTGLTRDGVYLVENGEITGAVNNFRFNESPVDLLRRFTHASATGPAFSREWGDDYFSRTAMPALRVPDFNMSSVSQAM